MTNSFFNELNCLFKWKEWWLNNFTQQATTPSTWPHLQHQSLKAQQLICENSANFYAISFVALKQIDEFCAQVFFFKN
jgi:hypothetical protein